MEDQEGKERILINSPRQKTFIRAGASNDPDYVENEDSGAGIRIKTEGKYQLEADKNSKSHFKDDYTVEVDGDYHLHSHHNWFETSTDKHGIVLGTSNELFIGEKTDATLGALVKLHLLNVDEIKLGIFTELMLALKISAVFGYELKFGTGLIELNPDTISFKAFKAEAGIAFTDMAAIHTVLAGIQTTLGLASLRGGLAIGDAALLKVDATLETMTAEEFYSAIRSNSDSLALAASGVAAITSFL